MGPFYTLLRNWLYMAVKTVNLIKTLKVSFLIKLRNLAAEQGKNKYKHFWNPRVKSLK